MSLIRNSIWNLGGFIVPTIIAIPSFGFLSRCLGIERFGLFTLAFAVIGYASIFDVGLTRAVIREISINRNNWPEQKRIISTATSAVLLLSILAAFLMYNSVSWLSSILKISAEIEIDAAFSFKVLSICIPIFLINQVWLAYLEGHEQFLNINIQKSISNSCIVGFPVLFCACSPSLTTAIIGLFLGRLISLFLGFYFSRKIILSSGLEFDIVTFKRLIKFGGWMTLSNIISPIMAYFDRFIISNMWGANKVAFYTAPSEGVSRALNVPIALARALFPKLSNATEKSERIRLEKLSYFAISIVCVPIITIGFIYSTEIMGLWMGHEYEGESANILRILLIGLFFNGVAQIPFAKIQAIGKSHITAIIHLLELVPYLFLLYFLSNHYSLIGVAIAWTIRVTVDFIALFLCSKKYG